MKGNERRKKNGGEDMGELVLIEPKTGQDWYWSVESRSELLGVIERKTEIAEWCLKDADNRDAFLQAVQAVEGTERGLAVKLERLFREGRGAGLEAFAGAVRRVLAEGCGAVDAIVEEWQRERKEKEAVASKTGEENSAPAAAASPEPVPPPAVSAPPPPVPRKRIDGLAVVAQIFHLRYGKVASCVCVKGKISLRGRVRVKREGVVLWEGCIASMEHFRTSVNEVVEGQVFGVMLRNFTGFELEDVLESY